MDEITVVNISRLGLTIHGELVINDLECIGITDPLKFNKIVELLIRNISVVACKWIWTGKLRNNRPYIYFSNKSNKPAMNIVYILFCRETKSKIYLNPKDGNLSNIIVTNLEESFGPAGFAFNRNLKDHEIVDISKLREEGKQLRLIAEQYDITRQAVSQILLGKVYKHVERKIFEPDSSKIRLKQ